MVATGGTLRCWAFQPGWCEHISVRHVHWHYASTTSAPRQHHASTTPAHQHTPRLLAHPPASRQHHASASTYATFIGTPASHQLPLPLLCHVFTEPYLIEQPAHRHPGVRLKDRFEQPSPPTARGRVTVASILFAHLHVRCPPMGRTCRQASGTKNIPAMGVCSTLFLVMKRTGSGCPTR